MKDMLPKFIVAVCMLAITALLTGLIFTMFDDNESTYKEASAHIDTIQNKEKDNETWMCPECGAENEKTRLNCISCGKKNPWHND